MNSKTAKAPVEPIRQTSQYNCMSASMSMCLKALGVSPEECTTDLVNRVMGARPMTGASWEDAIACAQHYGMRVHLICPATLSQVKEWTDRGIPVMIAWNPEGRPWSHASVVFDVAGDRVHVADPNIPDPAQTVRIVPVEEFYKKWSENRGDYLVRRTALAVMREITPDGKQVVASRKTAKGQPPQAPMGKLVLDVSTTPNFDYPEGSLERDVPAITRFVVVDDLKEAQKVFQRHTRDIGSGNNTGGMVYSADRTPVAYISYNGRIWEVDAHGKSTRTEIRLASYKGNPGGQSIYPAEIDHGYDQALAGGSDVMKRLQNQLLREQGGIPRPANPHLAGAHRVATRYLQRSLGGVR